MAKINQDLFRGHVDTIVLKALSTEPKYGYEILSIISETSKDVYNIKQSTLYSILKRLEKNGLISSYLGDESMGGRRRYYALTDDGRLYLEKEQSDWEFSRTLLDVLVSDKQVPLESIKQTYNPSELSPLTKRNKSIDEESYYELLEAKEETSKNQTIESENKISDAEDTSTNDTIAENESNNYVDENNEEDIDSDNLNENEATEDSKDISHALKSLKLGEYATEDASIIIEPILKSINKNTSEFVQNAESNDQVISQNDQNNENINYKDELEQLFNKKKEHQNESKTRFQEESLRLEENPHRVQHFNDLKQSLLLEGYRLKPYNKFDSLNYYYMKYIYSNKLMRDTSYIVSMLFFIFSLFITIFSKQIGINIIGPLIMTIIFSLYPIVTTIIWNIHPTKRIKAKYNLTLSLIKTSIIILLTISITVIVHIISGDITYEGKKI